MSGPAKTTTVMFKATALLRVTSILVRIWIVRTYDFCSDCS
jgi:hypothetical protein